MRNIQISDKVFHIGVNDRKKHLFENMWPLPNGVAYNSYLIVDEKTALLDTVENGSDMSFLCRVEKCLDGKILDYLIINHMEPDHSGQINELLSKYPDIKIIGNNKTRKIFEGYYGQCANFQDIADGDTLNLGYHNLKFVMTPWVHWPETMMTYDTTEQILFSGDAFGSFGTLDGGVFDDEVNFGFYEDEMRRYYSNIVGKYSNMVQKALTRLSETPIKIVAPLHGIIWRTDPCKVISLYDRWSKYEAEEGVVIAFASMYGNSEQTADYIARKISEQGVKNIRVFDVSKTHVSYIISEIWKYKGLVLGSCAYNTSMHPNMEMLTNELKHIGVKERYLGIFGSYSWNGGGVRSLKTFADESCMELVAEPCDILGIPTIEKLLVCDQIAEKMAEKIRQ